MKCSVCNKKVAKLTCRCPFCGSVINTREKNVKRKKIITTLTIIVCIVILFLLKEIITPSSFIGKEINNGFLESLSALTGIWLLPALFDKTDEEAIDLSIFYLIILNSILFLFSRFLYVKINHSFLFRITYFIVYVPVFIFVFSYEFNFFIEIRDKGKKMFRYAWENNCDAVKMLLQKGANVNYNNIGNDAITVPVMVNNELVEKEMQGSALKAAIANNNDEMLKWLIQYGANVNAFWSPLISAVNNKNISAVRILLNAGADVNNKDGFGNGKTALQWAAMKGHDDIIKFLKEAGAKE